jgi:hypothetical protein
MFLSLFRKRQTATKKGYKEVCSTTNSFFSRTESEILIPQLATQMYKHKLSLLIGSTSSKKVTQRFALNSHMSTLYYHLLSFFWTTQFFLFWNVWMWVCVDTLIKNDLSLSPCECCWIFFVLFWVLVGLHASEAMRRQRISVRFFDSCNRHHLSLTLTHTIELMKHEEEIQPILGSSPSARVTFSLSLSFQIIWKILNLLSWLSIRVFFFD